jgi:hypothetical protein
VFKRDEVPLNKKSSLSPFKERGIKGMRLINNLGNRRDRKSYKLIFT